MRLLIVEDEADLAELFRAYVVALGHHAEVVHSAEAALQRLAAAPPQAIVLDVKLPGMSGLDFLRLAVVRELGLPVIVVSGHANEHQARECLQLGALEFLAKPVPLDVLGTVLQHAEVFAPAGQGRGRERRGARRVALTLPLRAVAAGDRVLHGSVIEASATGLRARLDASVRVGSPLRLHISLPDGPPLETRALVVRNDGDGTVALWFLALAPADVDRLLARGR
jgi:CheY-like chemotaxis protein